MIILNLKNYPESSGANAIKLLSALEILSSEQKKYLSIAPSVIDLLTIKTNFPNLNIISQYVENLEKGNTTGWVGIEQLKSNQVKFSLYNHSEHRVWNDEILENILSIQKNGIDLIVCCENLEEAEIILKSKPFGIAYEPKDLIGSDVSVTSRPDAVKEFLDLVKKDSTAFIGAGIQGREDVEKGLELGAEGFIVSSSFVKSSDPKLFIQEIVTPFLKLPQKFFQ
jgi:triosephosphate isomerase